MQGMINSDFLLKQFLLYQKQSKCPSSLSIFLKKPCGHFVFETEPRVHTSIVIKCSAKPPKK